jgi:hypothetical protein
LVPFLEVSLHRGLGSQPERLIERESEKHKPNRSEMIAGEMKQGYSSLFNLPLCRLCPFALGALSTIQMKTDFFHFYF